MDMSVRSAAVETFSANELRKQQQVSGGQETSVRETLPPFPLLTPLDATTSVADIIGTIENQLEDFKTLANENDFEMTDHQRNVLKKFEALKVKATIQDSIIEELKVTQNKSLLEKLKKAKEKCKHK